jgi:isopentenyldiphosphate isomerase
MMVTLDLNNPNPYLADSRNTMFIHKVAGSKVVWSASWLNKVGQPVGDRFSTLKLAKKKAEEMGIPFKVSRHEWVTY